MKKRLVSLLLGLMLVGVLFGCGSAPEKEPADYMDDFELFGVEAGTIYYDVYLTSDVEWEEDEEKQEKIALYSIGWVRDFVNGSDSPLFEGAFALKVMGYKQDGNLAFSWEGYVDDVFGSMIYYEDGVQDRTDFKEDWFNEGEHADEAA